jgi:hypothetical protein
VPLTSPPELVSPVQRQQDTQLRNEASTHDLEDIVREGVNYITAEQHFSTNISSDWQKLNEYYKHLGDNLVYDAEVVLHPQMKWRYFKTKWSDREDWLSTRKVEHKAPSTSMTSAGTDSDTEVKIVKRAVDKWSDGKDLGLDQLERYLSKQPD